MLDQNTFMETVRGVSEIIRTSQEPLTKEEIMGYFKDLELNEEQQELVFQYFLTPHEEPALEEEQEEEPETVPEPEEEILPDSKMFAMYLEELKGLPTYTDAEMDRLYERLLAGEEDVIRTLADAWLGRVLKLAQKLAVSSGDFEDIVQEGNMGLFLKLTELCGQGAGIDVEQEVTLAAEKAMQECISELAGEDDSEDAMVGKINLVNEARKYLAEEKGTLPTPEELADYTKLTGEELSDILAIIEQAERK